MRFSTLFFTVITLNFAPPFTGLHAEISNCSILGNTCPAPGSAPSFRQNYEIASLSCEIEQKSLKCDSLAAIDPELKYKIRRCSPQGLCEDSKNQLGMALQGCFWNAPGAWGSEIWESIKAGTDKSQSCLKDKKCSSQVFMNLASFSHPLLMILKVRQKPSLNLDFEKSQEALNHLLEGGRDWIKQKGVELQCFDRQAQMELLCYGVLNVFAPGAALKVASKAPRIVQLLKLNRSQNEGGLRNSIDNSQVSTSLPMERAKFIDQLLKSEFTTTEQNLQWIRIAGNLKPDGKTKFFEVENSVMKFLNDTTQDKNFVTALTNKQKQILKSKMDAFASRNPNVEVLPYSDFKAMRFALRPLPPTKSLPDSLEKELAATFKAANQEFVDYMKANQLSRASDRTEDWFRAGFGETADQATLASRYSRNISGENRMRSFKDHDLHENLQTTLKATEMFRRDLQSDLLNSGLMEPVSGTSHMTFRKEVFEAIRKTSTSEELKESLEKGLGARLTESQARKIRDYSDLVEEFSPGIHVGKREVATLSDSSNGGLSLDFSGLGALNMKATAGALTKSEKIEDAVIQTRLAEKFVTETFQERKETVRQTLQKILERNEIKSEIVTSGDDMVIKPNKPIPSKVRAEIAQELSKQIDPSSVRTSHVPSGITSPGDRMMVATHGETIEKLTRKNLQGQLPKEKLEQVLFLVDMNAKNSGNGSAQLILGMGRTELNDLEIQRIRKAFEKAIQDLNQNLKKENLPASYRPAS